MALALTPSQSLVTFGVPDGHTLTVTVVDGDPVEFASDHGGGPFTDDHVDGEIASGAAHDFTTAVSLRTTGTSSIDVETVAPGHEDLPPTDAPPPEP